METNCTVQAPEWQRVGECQARRWKTMKQEPRVFVGDSDLTDPSIKYLLKRGRKGISTGCSEIRRIDYGGFVPSWWHGVAGGGGWDGRRRGGTGTVPQRLCTQTFLNWLQTGCLTSSQGLTGLWAEPRKNKHEAQHFLSRRTWRRPLQFVRRAIFFLLLSKIASRFKWGGDAARLQCNNLVRPSF